MSDSDSDNIMQPNNTYAYQSGSTMVSVKGPNISQNFRSNNLTSTMNAPWNLERARYAQSVCDQRSIGHRRETSMMSLHGQSGNFYQGRAESYRGTFNGRSRSPAMSTRTIDSNVSAIDIAAAFKTQKFNECDVQTIRNAYRKFMKHRLRKRVEKRKNLRSFLKGSRCRYEDDSGDEGSDSSISSDDCRSTRTCWTNYHSNTSRCRSTKTDFADFRKTMTESNIYRDCTDSFRQNSLRNMCSVEPRIVKENTLKPQNLLHSNVSISQKDRFKNGFLLPSHRFNQLIASLPIPEKENRWQRPNIDNNVRNVENGNKRQERVMSRENESEQEEIFSETTVIEKSTLNGSRTQCKRRLDADGEIHTSNNKRCKLSSPQTRKPASKLTVPKQTNSGNDPKKSKDFEFAKPQFPIKKLGNTGKVVYKTQLAKKNFPSTELQSSEQLISSSNQQSAEKSILKSGQKSTKSSEKPIEKTMPKSVHEPTEKLISKSAQQEIVVSNGDGNILEHPPAKQNLLQTDNHQERDNNEETNQFSTTDMSMRPSFIKRKLFTQKVDAESKNSSSDNLTDSSQSNIYSAIQKEKNKTRKITTQSCLSRDILGDESNLLDLIHKIVPKDRMNTTNAANKTDITNKSKPADAENKWDVTAVISTCNKDDVSDTYTDEEIFKVDESNITTNKKKNVKVNTPKQNSAKKCKVVVEKIPENNGIFTNVARQSVSPEVVKATKKIISPAGDNGLKKSSLYDCVKSFWDTDDESDMDYGGSSLRKSNLKDNLTEGTSINKNATTNILNTKKHEISINKQQLQTKTKLAKNAEKDVGINKNHQLTTSKSQEPKSKPKPVQTKNQEDSNKKPNSKTNTENNNKTSKKKEVTSRSRKTKNVDDKDLNTKKKEVTPKKVNKKNQEDSNRKPNSKTNTENNDKTVSSKKKEVTSRSMKTKNFDDKDMNTKKNEVTPKKVNKKNQEDANRKPNSKTNTENNEKTVNSQEKEVTSRSMKTKNFDDKDLNTKKNEVTPKKVNKKNQEDANRKPNSKTNTENNNKTVSAQKKEVTSRSIKTKNVDDKDLKTKKYEITTPKKVNKKILENINKTVTTKKTDEENFKKIKNGETVKATNNNTLKVRPQTGQPISDKTLSESNDTFIKTLRTRAIDLSSSFISEKTSPSNKPAPKRGRPPKNNNVTKISKENSRSDISFSLTDKISPSSKSNKKMSALMKIKNAGMKPRRSDISFSLISDKKCLNKTTGDYKRSCRANNSSKISHKEVESLQMSASFFLSTCEKSSRTSRKIPCC